MPTSLHKWWCVILNELEVGLSEKQAVILNFCQLCLNCFVCVCFTAVTPLSPCLDFYFLKCTIVGYISFKPATFFPSINLLAMTCSGSWLYFGIFIILFTCNVTIHANHETGYFTLIKLWQTIQFGQQISSNYFGCALSGKEQHRKSGARKTFFFLCQEKWTVNI